jgi:biotin carboxylase
VMGFMATRLASPHKHKKILLLGGSHAQLPIITKAKSLGLQTVVCDMNEACEGRRFADRFFHASTTDFDAIRRIALAEAVDGIATYASDPSAQAVAVVGNDLGLPSNPAAAVSILTKKHEFRNYLRERGFFTPLSEVAPDVESAIRIASSITGTILIKPTDSSGSRGISKIAPDERNADVFAHAYFSAKQFSSSGTVIVESFLTRSGYQVAGDGFLVDGKIAFRCFANEHFHPSFNPVVPVGESFPSVWGRETQSRAHQVLQSILTGLGMERGALNFDFAVLDDGQIFVIEIGPRNGGNLIPEVTRLATGVDMIEATLLSALDLPTPSVEMIEPTGFHSSYVFHVKEAGIFKGIEVNPDIRKNVLELREYCAPGEIFTEFNVRNHRLLGSMILRFDSADEMLDKIDNMDRFVAVHVESARGSAARAGSL